MPPPAHAPRRPFSGHQRPPQHQPPPQHLPPHKQQFDPNFPYLQNPNFFLSQNPNQILQGNNFLIQNPNPNYFHPPQIQLQYQAIPAVSPPISNVSAFAGGSDFWGQNNRPVAPKGHEMWKRESVGVGRIEGVVVKVRKQLIMKGESVSAWKVSQAVLVAMEADSWDSLGFQMQEILSLKQLIVVEGKINAFINCYVGIQRITSLFDLEVAICKNEGIEKFEELELGPLLKHPLVMHYFAVGSDVTSVYKITSQEIVSHLSELIDLRKGKSFGNEDFLKFFAKKCQVDSLEKLGVRIQSLGMYIDFIRQASSSEDSVLQKCRKKAETNSMKKRKKRPLLSLEKQHLDERFSAITQRITSFSSMNKDFCGKYTRFPSSSSDDDEDDGNDRSHDDNEEQDDNNGHSPCLLSSFKSNNCNRVSNCPHPSVYEERKRLGLKSEVGSASSPSCRSNVSHVEQGKRKKRRFDHPNDSTPSLHKSRSGKKSERKYLFKTTDDAEMDQSDFDETSLLLGKDSLRMFITTWKEACREHNAAKVFEKMLDFYDASSQQKNNMKSVFSTYPFLGLLNVAVTSIKDGIWDSMYDAFQSITDLGETDQPSSIDPEFESIDIEESGPLSLNMQLRGHSLRLTVDDIMNKVKEFFAFGIRIPSSVKTPVEKILFFVRKLSECEAWLCLHFLVKEFPSLGYGEYLMFLEKHSSILPTELCEFLESQVLRHFPFEVVMLPKLLVSLLSQATGSLWVDESVTKQKILDLVIRQYPTVSFTFSENGSLDDLLNIVKQQGSNTLYSSVLFSAALSGTYKYNGSMHSVGEVIKGTIGQIEGTTDSVASRKALDVLLKAPMLCDLNAWSHWDILYAPSLGPLLRWLLNGVSARDLLCLVTKDGKIVRIDPLASIKSFFESLLQGSSFQVAVSILSLFAIYGGRTQAPLSLLKHQSCQAFEALLSSSNDNIGTKGLTQKRTDARVGLKNETEPISHLCKLALDCLSYLPSEFRSFAAEILLCGLQSIAKDAASSVLFECKKAEERLMLHELGFCLGIMEWIDDHSAVCPLTDGNSLYSIENVSVVTEKFRQERLVESGCYETKLPLSIIEDQKCKKSTDIKSLKEGSDTYQREEKIGQAEVALEKDAELLIESIRREEFGLDPNLTEGESSILKKQHARLGRALHCLSQELYSQDSHFLLELVQNADDNLYPREAEPTLMFILQDTSIVILNNEQGFTAKNIRALCDVGSSTKKGSAGYIGQKGIGFKSVFRVTDAPEIHSNGFHVKFDISEGQIGFVLPTIVPPCNMNLITQLASAGAHKMADYSWNTCIVLPFRSKLSDGASANSLFSMFSDLRPSLLLFLHRLRRIMFKNVIDDSLIVMRKEIVGNGIVNVTQGKEKTTWFLASQRLRPEGLRDKVEETEISIAFSLQESAYGYESWLEPQPVFAFLPLRTYGLKFILQGDFVLPSSREEVDGDSPWNQWLLSEFPGLFVNAQKSFSALHCYEENRGKAMSVYMSFVPLVGEVHGFFSCLPQMIISKLRLSNCLLLEGSKDEWVPPCKVIRGWNENARLLLPDTLLLKHLGLGFLDKDIILSDSLASSLGIVQYGPKLLVKLLISLSLAENGLKSMELSWLSSLLNEIYNMLTFSQGQQVFKNSEEADLISSLKGVPFIPLSDGSYSSLNEGAIWLSADSLSSGFDGEHGYNDLPHLFATLRIVSPALFAASDMSVTDATLINNVSQMLHKIGVQRLSAHDIIKVHVLPSICDEKIAKSNKDLMIDYFSFVMLHFQSICVECHVERESLISELCNKALVFTNDGYKKPIESSIHFSRGYGNSFDVSKVLHGLDYQWLEVDLPYLKHPVTGPLPGGMMKWREFFQHLGVTDFVKVVQVQKPIAELSHYILQRVVTEGCVISPGLIATDWESNELTWILSMISNNGNQDRSKYLMEILDALWDVHFHDKTVGYFSGESGCTDLAFKSSFMNEICGAQWVASTMDNQLHYPNELFYDCEAVRSVVGASAPYVIPKVKSEKLLIDLGLKTQVSVDDISALLQLWRGSESPFRTSISQMSKFYTFIWSALSTSRQKVMEALNSGAFVFIPSVLWNSREDDVAGVILSPGEVYWHDSTGAMDYMLQQNYSTVGPDGAVRQTLSNIYPGLFAFFVNECGVNESPPLQKYISILHQLSSNSLPLQAAKIVFQVLVRWSDGFSCGTVSSDDIAYLKERLSQPNFTVLPTTFYQWVSLHPSFGLLCWCDNDVLRQEFFHCENINFLYFGELCAEEKEVVRTKVSLLLQKLGIPSLSEVVSREAVYYGPANSYLLASLVNWALPFAQRYIYNFHSDQYQQLKLSGCGFNLRVVVVEQLFYRNVIKKSGTSSKIRHDCSCLLQEYTLYATQGSDPHSVFMELSRLFFGGAPQPLANFLFMIKSMAESGCTGEYLESFIVNGQKMVKLPDEESVWSLVSTSTENVEAYSLSAPVEVSTSEQHIPFSNYKKNVVNYSSWPPVDWKTAPDFRNAHANGLRVKTGNMGYNLVNNNVSRSGNASQRESNDPVLMGIQDDMIIEEEDIDAVASAPPVVGLDETISMPASAAASINPVDIVVVEPQFPEAGPSKPSEPDQIVGAQQAILVGKLGESVASRYLSGKYGDKAVIRWMNEDDETGLPYDIVVKEEGRSEEYIEVKATRYESKAWFIISTREWKFAQDKGDAYSIAHVTLSSGKAAKITMYKNPVKLCQSGKLRLAMMIPKPQF
ncbi:NO VEIN-like protein [Drosera capensis]